MKVDEPKRGRRGAGSRERAAARRAAARRGADAPQAAGPAAEGRWRAPRFDVIPLACEITAYAPDDTPLF